MQTLAEVLGGRQADLARVVSERLDAVSHRLGERCRHRRARHLREPVAICTNGSPSSTPRQTRIAELSAHMITLKDVLANKQARGAFGQGRMEAIVADGLPKDAYAFQHTLTNGKRPGLRRVSARRRRAPAGDRREVPARIRHRAARSARTRTTAAPRSQRLRQDIAKHVSDISERYLLPGETQDVALMFVPSESVFAELHEQFDDLVQKAFRARVLLVSPSLLMLAIQVLQAIVKDARMREHADVIRTEVTKLIDDVGRLRDRALNLQKHFAQASDDVGQVLISAEKVVKRGNRIEAIEFEEAADHGPRAEAPSLPLGRRAAE